MIADGLRRPDLGCGAAALACKGREAKLALDRSTKVAGVEKLNHALIAPDVNIGGTAFSNEGSERVHVHVKSRGIMSWHRLEDEIANQTRS